jgi:hypothetical protein
MRRERMHARANRRGTRRPEQQRAQGARPSAAEPEAIGVALIGNRGDLERGLAEAGIGPHFGDDPASELHNRYDVGVEAHDGYFSIDTGKFTAAPLFADHLARLVSGGRSRRTAHDSPVASEVVGTHLGPAPAGS